MLPFTYYRVAHFCCLGFVDEYEDISLGGSTLSLSFHSIGSSTSIFKLNTTRTKLPVVRQIGARNHQEPASDHVSALTES